MFNKQTKKLTRGFNQGLTTLNMTTKAEGALTTNKRCKVSG